MTDTRTARMLAEQLHALGEPTRIRLLSELLAGPRTGGELVTALGVHKAYVSNHLQVLRAVGILANVKQGRHVYYAFAPGVWSSGELTLAGGWRVRVRP